jgi:DNA-binding NtrC family response regulator
MGGRKILLADRDGELRRRMAENFRNEGYKVETTDSAVHVFCTVLEKRVPVVLLGSGFDKEINLPDLVRLLKQCNRQVTIILISDEESLPMVRTIRQEGIFYHALKPADGYDTEEIRLAVECAFKKPEKSDETA